ncbi:MAG TPA: HD domain-containing phosphohydrolase, partial [Thermoanaerobaculia bacterium]|nr:HD domain-containing phosphohydrolase [Thermoanaerobaculia bacterium]
MTKARRLARSTPLRHLIFLLLVGSGLIPLATATTLLTRQNIEALETQEQYFLTRSAQALSQDLGEYLVTVTRQLEQLGAGLLTLPGPDSVEERLRAPGVDRYFASFLLANQDRLTGLRVLDLQGIGPSMGHGSLAEEVRLALDSAFEEARGDRAPSYQFASNSLGNEPLVVLAVPIFDPEAGEAERGEPQLILEAVVRLALLEGVFSREAQAEVAVFLVDRLGSVLWAEGADESTSRALASSGLVQDFRTRPLNLTAEYTLFVRGEKQRMLGRVSPVEETGWGVVVHKPLSAAYLAVRRLIWSAVVSSLVLVLLAMVFGAVAARRFSSPIQHLAATTHEIAAGKFGQRVEVSGPGREVVELAEDFNRMSGHVESYVGRLKEAAQANRDLFIGAIRAFAAAVDAKDPYTRGHSERVASYSRTVAVYLGQSEEFQQRVWIAGVLHDVGKIGVEDRILKKGGVLTGEEYEIMKLHPSIGAEILAPLEALREMLPAVRWHHEAWNGRGYPDGLKGEQIPLIARVVAVADTFDAITTNRPYQNPYTP